LAKRSWNFAIVLAISLLNLSTNLLDASLNGLLVAGPFNQGRRVLGDFDLLCLAEVLDLDVLELDPEILGDQRTARQHGDVAEHGLAAITKAWSLDGADVEYASQPVHNQSRERFTFDIFGNHEQRTARMRDLFEQGYKIPQARNLLLVDQDQTVLQHAGHVRRVIDEVRGSVPLIELHAFGEFESGRVPLAFLDGDDPVAANALHGLGNQVADGLVVISRNGADLGNFCLRLDRLGSLLNVLDRRLDGPIDAAANDHRIRSEGNAPQTFVVDGAGQHSRGGRSVACGVAGLRRDLVDELGTHVLEGIVEFDFLAHGHAVFGDERIAEALIDDHVSPGRPHGDGHRVGQDLDAALQLESSPVVEQKLFRHFWRLLDSQIGRLLSLSGFGRAKLPLSLLLYHSQNPVRREPVALPIRTLFTRPLLHDLGQNIAFAKDLQILPLNLDVGPAVFAEQDFVADIDRDSRTFAAVENPAGADRDDFSTLRFLLSGVGKDDATRRPFLGTRGFDNDAIIQRFEGHVFV
jgi:hypothetical protein